MNTRPNRWFLLALGVAWLAALSGAVSARDADSECELRQISERIHVIVGSDHATCSEKTVEHPLTNPAIVIGDTGVILIDPGGSLQTGRLVLERIASVTDKPVVAVLNSHIHGLYWLGNQAVKERFPDAAVYAHRRMIERIENGEGAFWVKAMTGDYQGEATKLIVPDVALEGGETKQIAGLELRIHHTGHAHTDHDILVEIPAERAVFLGGLVVEPEVPSQGVPADANYSGQMDAIRYAIDLNAEHYIPGRGAPGGIALPQRALRFLAALYDGTQRYYDEGLADFEITERLKSDLADYTQWYDFAQLGGVVSQMYLQIEAASF